MKALTDAQFGAAAKRHARGETLKSITEDFGIPASMFRTLQHNSVRWREIQQRVSMGQVDLKVV